MRQIAMVMDLNKCLGCQTCTAACKTQWTNRFGREYMYWNNVETQPGKGYPKGYMDYNAGWDEKGNLKKGGLPNIPEDYGIPWEFNYKEILSGDAKTLKPDITSSWSANWDEDEGEGEYPNSYFFYLPRICNHCANPACLAACPNKAIHKRKEDGIVLVDLKRCKGVRDCISACPYKKVYFNPLRKREEIGIAGQSEKCIFCFPRIEKGLPPACAKQCVGRIRHVGYLDDEDSHVYRLVKKWKVALPLRPDFGTIPNVYYVPPLSPPKFNGSGEVTDEPRIPMEFLKKLFGSEVENTLKLLKEEMDKKAKGEKSELMDILIAYKHSDMFKI
jgi:complex iron-sulfur molybdoenzyme family reductase subunit beta